VLGGLGNGANLWKTFFFSRLVMAFDNATRVAFDSLIR
jgi:hypothetical protein